MNDKDEKQKYSQVIKIKNDKNKIKNYNNKTFRKYIPVITKKYK